MNTKNMKSDDFVIFAELNRDKFDDIVQTLMAHFENIQYGSQGDDWIWIHLDGDEKIEIDSFFSMELEVKGKYQYLPIIQQILQMLISELILQVFDPPKLDMTR
ncbi:MAG: hypothetical protein QM730_01555 [Anaerolineales bacterium]